MTKWIMPHEDTPVELTTPQKASPRYIMPHELEAKVEKVATPYETALAEAVVFGYLSGFVASGGIHRTQLLR